MPQSYSKKRGSRSQPDSDHYLFNVDTFWYNIDISNYDEVMEYQLKNTLQEGKDHLEEHGTKQTIKLNLDYYDQPLQFEINKGQAPLYFAQIRNNDVAIYFSKFYPKADNQLPVKVQINQELLWEKGLRVAVSETYDILESFGFTLNNGRVNRIDLACHSDQFHWNLEDVKKLHYPRNFSHTNFPNFYSLNPLTGEFETMTIGTRQRLFLRIYNKTRLQEKEKKPVFEYYYSQHDMTDNDVWNIEFEVGREYLKQLHDSDYHFFCNDLDDLVFNNKLSNIWTHLMDKFTHTSSHWSTLAKGDKNKFVQTDEIIDREKINDYSIDKEVPQIGGRLTKFLIGTEDNEIEYALNEFLKRWYDYERERGKVFRLETIKKKQQYLNDQINRKSKQKKMPSNSDR